MTELLKLEPKYSTTCNVVYEKPVLDVNPENELETFLFYPEGVGRKGEGGLRTKGYFKAPMNLFGEQSGTSVQKPLISIITVVFNGEQLLEKTIQSVINQTYDNVEYIIIDGGSTDRTIEIIQKYEHAIDYWISENDKGIYNAMNKGISLATGAWVNFMNGGDFFYRLDVLESMFDKRNYHGVGVIYGNHQVRYPSGRFRLAKSGKIENLWKGSQFCHQASFISLNYHKQNAFNLCEKIVADFEFFYIAWKRKVKFFRVNVTVASYESGGVSDVNRIDSIVGCWGKVDKNIKTSVFYSFKVLKESFKLVIKDVLK